ncbi:MAG: UDP-N-acetylmuramoyl-tripeptide--D-alanyl-D-alanine ligase [Sphingobacteriaceae bacterium]|nr:UDP-N-acetylmuramoyl-tripeptide--D-alanyl-D-alanine ligase [Sphingobacteriaceae bacterium]
MQVCTDTRSITNNSLFIALKGSNFNANTFALTALENGAKYVVVDEPEYQTSSKHFYVNDCLKALQQLSNYHRKQFTIPVLGITGSNAKTTHKELINAVLSEKFNVLYTMGNLNNHIGVPLTLLRLRKDHQFAIIEMGANHQGEIHELCQIAEPTYGLITNIGKAHLEGFGGIEGVKKGKSELYRFIQKTKGKIFLNGDDEVLQELSYGLEKFTYGRGLQNDILGKEDSTNACVSYRFCAKSNFTNWDNIQILHTKITGQYNFINLLAASAIGIYFGVNEELIKTALEKYEPNMNRSQLDKTNKNTLILDAYNANPDSMKVAIENFASFPAENKLLLLGDMFELGEYSALEHKKIIELIKEKQFKNVCFVGGEFFKLAENSYLFFNSTATCLEYLKNKNIAGATILIKGSRSMKMETLKEVL